ncbi:hypothetical protein INR49_027955 [Caranx melampygus]|nr:hypothetical protein INR49_027955 [Caranx melampygus]
MSRIAGVVLLFIILVDSFYESTVSPKGYRKCPVPLFPISDQERTDLFRCLCSKKHQFPDFQKPCTLWRTGYPISLV